MKKILIPSAILFSLLLFVSCKKEDVSSKVKKENLANAKKRDVEAKKGAPIIKFDKKKHEFGTVKEGDVVEAEFIVTNVGKTDLVIVNAQATCGCTVPIWPKEAIKPGESSKVLAKFNTTGKPNKQSKTITLFTNTAQGREVLRITGNVTPKAKK